MSVVSEISIHHTLSFVYSVLKLRLPNLVIKNDMHMFSIKLFQRIRHFNYKTGKDG